jgi:hypothetical protein
MHSFLRFLIFFSTSLISSLVSFGQLYEVSLPEKVAASKIVFEGKVISQQSFWNPERTMIFTSNTIEVYKVFKGLLTTSTVEILTQGGSVGDFSVETSHLLEMEPAEIGIFLTNPTRFNFKTNPINGKPLYDVVTELQGFLKYDLNHAEADAPFAHYSSIEGDLYPKMIQLTNQIPLVLNTDFRALPLKPGIIQNSVTISNFSPQFVVGGAHNDPANNRLTISGTGFGSGVAGNQVVFKDGNSSTANVPAFAVAFNNKLVKTWTDNQIVIDVPSRAATGNLAIVLAPGDTTIATGPLTVVSSVLTASFTSTGDILESRLMNHNGLGGYSFLFSNNIANSGTDITADSAYDCFLRALDTWVKTTGVSAINAGITTLQTVAGDGNNIVMFDNNAALSGAAAIGDGTLAVVYSYNSRCSGSLFSQKTGFDMVINKTGISGVIGQPFNVFYCLPRINTFDLEAILLHELGHCFNLAHVYGPQEQSGGFTTRNPGAVMHPTATLSVNRKSLDVSSLQGGLYCITPQGNVYGTCINPNVEMVLGPNQRPLNDNCPLVFPIQPTLSGAVLNINLEAATSDRSRDPFFRGIGNIGNTNGNGLMVTNNVYEVFRTNNAGSLDVTISNYRTVPVQHQAVCVSPVGLSAVQLTLYKTNSCPSGGNFPAPVFAGNFTGNLTFTIPNLEANTNYLLYFDGVYNTKAAFNASLISTVTLPVRFIDIYGVSNPSNNQLFLTYELSGDVAKMVVERSGDGNDFSDLGTLINIQSGKQVFTDERPLSGANYYRIRTEDRNGQVEYSKVVLLKRSAAGVITVYPVPMYNQLMVNLSAMPTGNYQIQLLDAVGRLVRQVSSGNRSVMLSVNELTRGVYFLQIKDQEGNIIKQEKLIK